MRAVRVMRKRAVRFPDAGVEMPDMVHLVANLTYLSTNCDQQKRPLGGASDLAPRRPKRRVEKYLFWAVDRRGRMRSGGTLKRSVECFFQFERRGILVPFGQPLIARTGREADPYFRDGPIDGGRANDPVERSSEVVPMPSGAVAQDPRHR